MKKLLAASVLALAAVLACVPAAEQIDLEAARAGLMEVDREFARATAENGLEGWGAFFSENSLFLSSTGPPATGKAAIDLLIGPTLGSPDASLHWDPEGADVAASGDLGYTWGAYELVQRDPAGVPILTNGKYLTSWKRHDDGSWNVAVIIANSPPGPLEASGE
jgi:ketosteroid isomerase-like protein